MPEDFCLRSTFACPSTAWFLKDLSSRTQKRFIFQSMRALRKIVRLFQLCSLLKRKKANSLPGLTFTMLASSLSTFTRLVDSLPRSRYLAKLTEASPQCSNFTKLVGPLTPLHSFSTIYLKYCTLRM